MPADTENMALNRGGQAQNYNTMAHPDNSHMDVGSWNDPISKAGKEPEWGHSPPTSHQHIYVGQSMQPEDEKKKDRIELQSLPLNGVLRQPTGQFVINIFLQIAAFAAAIAFGIFAIKSVRIASQANELANQANDIARRANVFADEAIGQAWLANQFTLIALCLSTDADVDIIREGCTAVINSAASVLRDTASSLFPAEPERPTSTTASIVPTLTSRMLTTRLTSTIPTSFMSSSTGGPSSTTATSDPTSSQTVLPPSSSPTSPPSSTSSTSPERPSGSLSSSGIGIIVGMIVLFLVLLAIGLLFWQFRKRKRASASSPGRASSISKFRNTVMQQFRSLFMDTRVVISEVGITKI